MRAASEQMRLSDFGPDTFRPGLARLIESIESDGRLTLFGRYFARRQLLELLTHRLQLVDYRSRHPEIADEVIRRPLFILGLPRTGTTLLYGLLAEDPANRAPLSWEIDDPCPPAETKTYQSDPRIERTQKRFAQVDALEDSMNRAGEEAAARAVPVFASAITSMSISDAFGILNGPDDAATSYFRERTSEELSNQFSPIAAEAMQKVGLYGLYQELIAR